MLNNKTIAVVVPAYNEEKQIGRVIETMPVFVDRIIVVNDCSKDRTEEIVKDYINSDKKSEITIDKIKPQKRNFHNEADLVLFKSNEDELKKMSPSEVINKNPESDRIILINMLKNSGVGACVARGYKWCKDYGIYCIAKIDGDGQMDPNELESICKPIVEEDIDYVKGNRLIHGSSWLVIPKFRFLGNSVLSILTKIASGYWKISDTQTAFTAISLKSIKSIKLHKIYESYGYPNDILVKLNISFCKIKEVEIKPVYDVGEKSKMKIFKVIPKISFLLFCSFFKRLWIKYLFKDFHPLFILYHLSFLLFVLCIPIGYKIISVFLDANRESGPVLNSILFLFLFVSAFQSFLFAMWMDIQDNDRLYK